MKVCLLCKQRKDISYFSKDKKRKDGFYVYCKQCVSRLYPETKKLYQEKNRLNKIAYMQEYHNIPANIEKRREYDKQRYWDNVEFHRVRARKYMQDNPDKRKANRDAHWERNPGSRNAAKMKRYASKKQATPVWAKDGYMNLWYRFAKIETERTGRVVEVDHMIPLQSEHVCGLHCEDNMQLLFQDDNRKKQNTSWPQMW